MLFGVNDEELSAGLDSVPGKAVGEEIDGSLDCVQFLGWHDLDPFYSARVRDAILRCKEALSHS